MKTRRLFLFMSLVLALVALSWGADQAWTQKAPSVQIERPTATERQAALAGRPKSAGPQLGRIGPAQRKAAAARAKAAGRQPGAAAIKTQATPLAATPAIPHYFGPYANYANSPLPKGSIASITVDNGGGGYSDPVVTIADVYGTGSGATATAMVSAGVITGIIVDNPGIGYSAPVVTIEDASGMDAAATPTIGGPFDVGSGMRKFVDKVAGLNVAGINGLGQYIPVAIPDQTTYQGSDYYEIEVGQYTEQLHSDLPPTTLRGYRQTNTTDGTVSEFHYLGPLIIAQRDKPVRIKFTNSLPPGAGGDLFIPVDTTIMGAGMGPTGEEYTQNRATLHNHGALVPWISDGTPHQWTVPVGDPSSYQRGPSARNVPDMWFLNGQTVAGCAGQTICDVPGATNDPGQGSLTFYYNNQQSARLLFYHEHAVGITRLGVYAGQAGGYLISDTVDQDLINGTNVSGVNPGLIKVLPDLGAPLIIQDRTFVDATTIAAQDPNWRWGTGAIDPVTGWPVPKTGDLWLPSVYMPAQNPYDMTGASAFGRWQYGPWFWPPTPITFPPVANEYYNPACDASLTWCEPPERPDTPNPSMGMEAFNDTPLVNGTAYPYMEVEPKAYRFRILNAANDRFVNLQMYVAADKNTPTTAGTTGAVLCDGNATVNLEDCTEVKMVPAVKTTGYPATWSTDGREGGVPDPTTAGPSWIQIGTEGGFLPAPVLIPNQPINWNGNATAFNVGNVTDHSLLVAPAERADVVVDFSQFAGKTLILYNDAPAAFPALDPRYDYYTGNPNQMDTGGTPTTQPGYGPNIRTIMQIRVGSTVTPGTDTPGVTLANLQTVFAKTASKSGVFEVSQEPIIVPQQAYNSAYDMALPFNVARDFVRIYETFKSFTPLGSTTPVSISFEPKAIHDEMGAAYDTEYGRMGGLLGLELLGTSALNQNVILYGYDSPPTDVMQDSMAPIGQLGDGTQIWKITHNGVDTHPIHFHLFNVQLINRVAWDGALLPPEPNELGWKETVRVNPLEDTIVAMRPIAPTQPFDVPNSIRLINPAMPEGAVLSGPPGGFVDPELNAVTVLNHYVNFGWEYVWHCHILSHEEMDMMHSLVFAVAPDAPDGLFAVLTGASVASLTWTDTSVTETEFKVERALNADFTTGLTTFTVPGSNPGSLAGVQMAFTDTTIAADTPYYYRVVASNVVGDTQEYVGAVGFPQKIVDSQPSNTASLAIDVPYATVAPTSLNFGNQIVGTTSAAQPVTLSNTGGAPLTFGVALSGTNAGEFAQANSCGGTVAPGGSCVISITFAPSASGARDATLDITTNDTAHPQLAVQLGGTGLVPVAGVAPASLDFGNQIVGTTSAAQPVTLSNTGGAPLTFGVALSGTNAGEFAQVNSCGGTVAPGGSCVISVTFAPSAAGARSASLDITTNDTANPQLAVSLSGTGLVPVAGVAPMSLSFGDQLVGTTSVAQTVTLSNTGGALLTFSVAMNGTNPGDFAQANSCGGTLAPGGSCVISVTFAPSAAGARSASLDITTNDTAHPQLAVSLNGTGLSGPVAGVAPTGLNFTDQEVGTTSAAQTVTLSNMGGAPLTFNITRGGTDRRDFTQSSTCGGTVAPGADCVVSVTFAPRAVGPRSASLNFTTNDTAHPQLVVSLSGTATALSVPAAPSNPTGAAVRIPGNNRRDRATLTWTDNSNNETRFQIQRADNAAFTGRTTFTVGADVTRLVQNVLRSSDYYYRVRAMNRAGASVWSDVVLVTTP